MGSSSTLVIVIRVVVFFYVSLSSIIFSSYGFSHDSAVQSLYGTCGHNSNCWGLVKARVLFWRIFRCWRFFRRRLRSLLLKGFHGDFSSGNPVSGFLPSGFWGYILVLSPLVFRWACYCCDEGCPRCCLPENNSLGDIGRGESYIRHSWDMSSASKARICDGGFNALCHILNIVRIWMNKNWSYGNYMVIFFQVKK